MAPAAAGALQPYRILDLTTHRGWLAGKLLADLGARVTKIEPPGGDAGRMLAPFADDVPGPDSSLWWWAYNRGKRSATLDLSAPKARALFLRLAADADAVLESFEPGQLEAWGLGPEILRAANPRLVLTRITPFGQTGPYAGLAASDLILAAIGGSAWLTGDEDRAPLRVAAPQFFLHAGAEAALHTTVALFHAASTGEGQQIDVSAQAATARTLMDALPQAHTAGRLIRRETLGRPNEYSPIHSVFRCADGIVLSLVSSRSLPAYRDWARAEGEAIPDPIAAITDEALAGDRMLLASKPPEFLEQLAAWFDAFFAKRTRAELVAGGTRHRVLISGVNTLADILADEQLAARAYFQDVRQPGRDATVRHPSVWAHLTQTPLAQTAAAPRIGEHNEQVWRQEVGLDEAAFAALRREGTI
jgi:crotonobetainyl-CoA:carnitine CoA-transferase CaiB-like acyl-CoA transferase